MEPFVAAYKTVIPVLVGSITIRLTKLKGESKVAPLIAFVEGRIFQLRPLSVDM
jgi:hypothetical protein